MNPRIEMRCEFSNTYNLRRVKAKTGQVVEEVECANILTNNFFENIMSGNPGSYRILGISVGSGNSEPAETDNTIESFIAGTRNTISFHRSVDLEATPPTITRGATFRFNEGVAQGNISEVCLIANTSTGSGSNPSPSSPIMSRALIRDAAGNPTSITVLEDEFLDVTFSLQMKTVYGQSGVLLVSVTDGPPLEIPYEIRPIAMNNTSLWGGFTTRGTGNTYLDPSPSLLFDTGPTATTSTGFVGVTGLDEFISVGASGNIPQISSNYVFESHTLSPYDPIEKSVVQKLRLGLTKGNISGGFNSIFLGTHESNSSASGGGAFSQYQMLLGAPILKLPSQVFEIDFKISAGNAT